MDEYIYLGWICVFLFKIFQLEDVQIIRQFFLLQQFLVH